MTTIVKATSKGQVTLPVKWRRQFNTDNFLATEKDGVLELRPLDINDAVKKKEITVFDALRDNKGKGLKAKELSRLLKKTLS
ncbi:MAG: hypothetical protein COV60_00830 [Candidatus Magasanikbacteria bacterium CG11_big_fil_rev_8_21_14_0_20_43_7]|uniref:SpoVT-AbrB domain-containing protein n=1 Tax=Candidatus Magasanikbacteria bacterium CG11_big_fil_rev_8_21_14_0_20_43_7 TaxID=1974654 RepID=A0A2H0N374_9BACT|nr:MAG: hypothetical protein COV60_00830 [Candidatus Magasanikbacteria bacterium CG11_big_fil_rev_8_21_14_0_20_43_7]